ncbi:hypothetical protein O0I16_10475, partial [Staphylococcus pseudintermedius]|nr:hypothetical protein [Staphylococcus pseudintermedius]
LLNALSSHQPTLTKNLNFSHAHPCKDYASHRPFIMKQSICYHYKIHTKPALDVTIQSRFDILLKNSDLFLKHIVIL